MRQIELARGEDSSEYISPGQMVVWLRLTWQDWIGSMPIAFSGMVLDLWGLLLGQ